MHKDALPTAANHAGNAVVTGGARPRARVYTLFLGATLGMLIGILNFAAADNGWKLQEYFFNIVDAPIYSLIVSPHVLSGQPLTSTSAITDSCSVRLFLACYWMATGMVMASLLGFSNRRDP